MSVEAGELEFSRNWEVSYRDKEAGGAKQLLWKTTEVEEEEKKKKKNRMTEPKHKRAAAKEMSAVWNCIRTGGIFTLK